MSGGVHQACGGVQAAKSELETNHAGVDGQRLGIDPRRRDLPACRDQSEQDKHRNTPQSGARLNRSEESHQRMWEPGRKQQLRLQDYTNLAPQARSHPRRHLHIGLMYVAPNPIAAFEWAHHRVSSFAKVASSMAARCGVATGHVTADKTHAQLDRTLARFGTFLTGSIARLELMVGKFQMFAACHFRSFAIAFG